MKAFINYVLQFGNLNDRQIDLITSKAFELDLRKDEYFSEAGKIARQVGFILEGAIRVCYYNNKGEEITKYFIDENNLVVDIESFDNEICSSAYVQQSRIVNSFASVKRTGRNCCIRSLDGMLLYTG